MGEEKQSGSGTANILKAGNQIGHCMQSGLCKKKGWKGFAELCAQNESVSGLKAEDR